MNKLAINIALIPPEEIVNLSIEINKKFLTNTEDEIILNKDANVPHITLVQGVIDSDQVDNITKIIQGIASQSSPLELSIISIHTSEKSKYSDFVIQKTDEIKKLHKTILDKLKPYLSYDDVTKGMFDLPLKINELTLSWVQRFMNNSAYEKYSPHITFGRGIPDNIEFPIKFTASKLALYKLGNNCTCGKILFSTKISD